MRVYLRRGFEWRDILGDTVEFLNSYGYPVYTTTIVLSNVLYGNSSASLPPVPYVEYRRMRAQYAHPRRPARARA